MTSAVRYLSRDGHGKIMVDVKNKEITGFTRHGNEGDKDKALKKAFKFLESKSASMSPPLRAPLDL